ncbi:MAG: PilZ domain-containing protein [Oligoflexia bacterium]|nr:PilZ domain-containing protein [Oligoflexia bacterium]
MNDMTKKTYFKKISNEEKDDLLTRIANARAGLQVWGKGDRQIKKLQSIKYLGNLSLQDFIIEYNSTNVDGINNTTGKSFVTTYVGDDNRNYNLIANSVENDGITINPESLYLINLSYENLLYFSSAKIEVNNRASMLGDFCINFNNPIFKGDRRLSYRLRANKNCKISIRISDKGCSYFSKMEIPSNIKQTPALVFNEGKLFECIELNGKVVSKKLNITDLSKSPLAKIDFYQDITINLDQKTCEYIKSVGGIVPEKKYAAFDISVGGIAFVINFEEENLYPVGTIFNNVVINFDKIDYTVIQCQVVIAIKIEQINKIKLGVQFLKVGMDTESQLCRQINQELFKKMSKHKNFLES